MRFERVAIIGLGLIGSSLVRAIQSNGLASAIRGFDANPDVRAEAAALGLCAIAENLRDAVEDADLVVLCVPVGMCGNVAAAMTAWLKAGAIISDVGSVKQAVIRDVLPYIPEGVHFIPGHPIAGTEKSGPGAGFATLFKGRWCILTPLPGCDADAVARLSDMWQGMGANVEIMEAAHHDHVLAITSHLPHLIAYTIVGTATDLAEHLESEVIRYSAGGFRDFTRLAASNPVMWRDIFLNNREAVLDVLQRFSEDLTALQRAIRWGEGEVLLEKFTATQKIRKEIVEAKQD